MVLKDARGQRLSSKTTAWRRHLTSRCLDALPNFAVWFSPAAEAVVTTTIRLQFDGTFDRAFALDDQRYDRMAL